MCFTESVNNGPEAKNKKILILRSEHLALYPVHHTRHLGVVAAEVAASLAPAGDACQHEPSVRSLDREGPPTVPLTRVPRPVTVVRRLGAQL